MEVFLFICVLMVLVVRWAYLRNRLDAVENRLAVLERASINRALAGQFTAPAPPFIAPAPPATERPSPPPFTAPTPPPPLPFVRCPMRCGRRCNRFPLRCIAPARNVKPSSAVTGSPKSAPFLPSTPQLSSPHLRHRKT